MSTSEGLDHAEGASTRFMVASGGVRSEGYGHVKPGVCLGDGQTEAEGVPSQGGRGDALLRRMLSYLTYLWGMKASKSEKWVAKCIEIKNCGVTCVKMRKSGATFTTSRIERPNKSKSKNGGQISRSQKLRTSPPPTALPQFRHQ